MVIEEVIEDDVMEDTEEEVSTAAFVMDSGLASVSYRTVALSWAVNHPWTLHRPLVNQGLSHIQRVVFLLPPEAKE